MREPVTGRHSQQETQMKTNAHEILGKTITGIILKYADKPAETPQSQLWLLFSDNTCYEFYCLGDSIRPSGGVIANGLEHINHYMQDGYFVACKAMLDPHSGKVSCEVHDR
jgi:hypothetical protein